LFSVISSQLSIPASDAGSVNVIIKNMILNTLLIREKVIKVVRDFFFKKDFHEVITPVLNNSIPLEPNVYAFETKWKTIKGLKKLYLSTSPEANLKRMLAEKIGNCFSIGHSFRNLENSGPNHHPEFLMLEWYRENTDYKDIMSDTKELIKYISKKLNNKLDCNWNTYSMSTLFEKYAKMDLSLNLKEKEMIETAKNKGYHTKNASWEQLFNQIFLNEIEPHLGPDPMFITDFPACISPLCKKKIDSPDFAERFEFYINGIELGNGNTENTDIEDIKKSFESEKKERLKNNQLIPQNDDVFFNSIKKMQSKRYAGIGLGLDRLAMIFAKSQSITDIYQ
jgi:elongation factor P--beta-lysine ligase